MEDICKVKEYLNFPVFIKPSNSGSSVGVNKSLNENDFIDYAFFFVTALITKSVPIIRTNAMGRTIIQFEMKPAIM